jgi:hypothetical protein
MATTDTSNVELIITATQGAANAFVASEYDLDPFQRRAGFRLRGVEISVNPATLYDIASDTEWECQLFGRTAAAPTALYSAASYNIITRFPMAIALTTSGIATLVPKFVWEAFNPILLGCDSVGICVDSTGAASATITRALLFGDAVTLTQSEVDASRARFV